MNPVDADNGSVVVRTPVTLETVTAIRDQLRQATIDAGLSADRADLFVLALNEGMMNAILHGGGAGDVTLMVIPADGLVAVIEDVRGQHFELPATSPPPGQLGGRGLWLVKQICDRVTIRRGRRGTQLILSVAV